MANSPFDKEKSIAEKLAMIEAQEAEERKLAADAAAREAQERKKKKAADEAAASNLDAKIRRVLGQYAVNYGWRYSAKEVEKEVNNSPAKYLVSRNLRTELNSKILAVESKLLRKQRKKDAAKAFLCVLSVLFVVLCTLAAGAFTVYSFMTAETAQIFRIALGVEIAAVVVATVMAVVHFVKDNSTAFKVICVIFAVINVVAAVVIGVSGRLVEHDIMTGEDGFLYEMVDGEYYLFGCDSRVAELVISDLEEDIVGISADAFKGNTSLTSLTVDVSSLVIEDGAFRDCTALKTVRFVGGDTVLEGNVFKNCKKLESVVFDGGSYTFNGSNLFDDCALLKDVYMNGGSYVGGDSVRILGGLKKIAVHHGDAYIDVPLKGAGELTLVVYPGTDSIFAVKPDVLVFAEGFDFSGELSAERGTFDLKPLAPITYFPQSVTYIPDILGSDRKKYDVFYQGSADEWESLSIAGDGGLFDVANMNYKEKYITMHYNKNCRFWDTNNIEMGNG